MVTILQKVTTFPLEMIVLKDFCDISGLKISNYYSNPNNVTKNNVTNDKPFQKEDFAALKAQAPTNDVEKKKKKQRFIVYNAIYNKLFENSLNILENTIKIKEERTVIIFPTYDQSDKGQIEINPKVKQYYNKFDSIKSTIIFNRSYVCYLELPVFNNQKKDEYSKTIKYNFDNIRNLIINFNKNIANQKRLGGEENPIQNVLFILDVDKKGLFTGMYNKQLSQEKKDIVNKEYNSFLSNEGFRRKGVDDSAITITYSDIVKQVKNLKIETGISISTDIIPKDKFDKYILDLKENYKKIIDKEYKKSIDLQDNIKTLNIFYKIENADKVLEEKIQTGSNKLYYLYKDPGETLNKTDPSGNPIIKYKHVIGYFTLTSEERGIYRFREDASQFKVRKSAESSTAEISENTIQDDEEPENVETDKEIGMYDFAVKIKKKYGTYYYENLNNDTSNNNVESGTIESFRDKTEGSFKWFNLRDIDLSFLNKEEIKYYSDILFDKKTLIEFLKFKNKYTDKTNLSYEFLKINDSQELSEYCDFIHKKFKSNIKEKTLNPFTVTFNDNKIINNILSIIFETNTQFYLRGSNVTKDEARKDSNNSYKIVEYTLTDESAFQDETCTQAKDNTCVIEYNKKKEQKEKRIIRIVVTKTNIKDAGLLKSQVKCKTQKKKIIYDYKTLFANVTRKLATGQFFGGSIIGGSMNAINSNRSRKRRLKAKRYK